jgi:hypothetical protein
MKEVLMIFVFAVFFAGNVYSQPVPNQKEDGTQNTSQPVVIITEEEEEEEEELPAPAPHVAPVHPQALIYEEPQTETETTGWRNWNLIWGWCNLL